MQDGIREVVCDKCGKLWNALCYAESERLECPECHAMVEVPPTDGMVAISTATNSAIRQLLRRIKERFLFELEVSDSGQYELCNQIDAVVAQLPE